MKRRPPREIYSDTIALARDRQDLEARQTAATAERQQRIDAFNRDQLSRVSIYMQNQRDQQNAQARAQRAAAEGRQEAVARQQEIFNRQSQRGSQYGARQAAAAAAAAAELKYAQKLARAQAISQGITQGNAQEQMQAIAQSLALSKRLKKEDKAKAVVATNIQKIFRGNEGRINAALIRNQNRINARNAADAAAADAARQSAAETVARQEEIFNRQSQRMAQYEARKARATAVRQTAAQIAEAAIAKAVAETDAQIAEEKANKARKARELLGQLSNYGTT